MIRKKLRYGVPICAMACMLSTVTVNAQNPIIQTTYTADPSPIVYGDTIYVVTTRDELRETMTDDWSLMNEWRCYSSKDMVNWTDLGQIAHAETFDRVNSNSSNWRAWAQDIVMKPQLVDGVWKDKFYLFAPFNGTKMDVAVADHPWGPYEDATPGTFLIDGTWDAGNIDPSVFIDDHGNPEDKENYDAYMYWGNPYLRYCKLTDDLLDVDPDMDGDGIISDDEASLDSRFSREDNKINGVVKPGLYSYQMFGEEGYASFGVPTVNPSSTGKFPMEPKGSEQLRSAFEEGPWLFHRDDANPFTDDYFMIFVGGRTPGETIEYSTGPTPTGPWTHKGVLFEREFGFQCNHPGMVEYKGHYYLFYLNEMLVGGGGSNRSVCVKEVYFDDNNLIIKETDEVTLPLLKQGIEDSKKGTSFFSVDPIGTLNPYELNQAETICWESNLEGSTGGFNGTPLGVKTKAKQEYEDAFWQSAARSGVVVYDIDDDDYIMLREVDFGNLGPIKFTVDAACGEGYPNENEVVDDKGIVISNPNADTVGGTIEVWADYESDKAKKITSLDITNTGGTNTYKTFETSDVEQITGVHDLYFIFKGDENEKLFQFDSWSFEAFKLAEPEKDIVLPSATPQPIVPVAPSAVPSVVPVQSQVKISTPMLKKLNRTKKTLQIRWSKGKDISGYKVYLSTKKQKGYKVIASIKTSKLNYRLKKLAKNKKYYVKVRAYKNVDGKKVYSDYSKIKTFRR